MGTEKAQKVIVTLMVTALLGLTAYSQTGVDPGSQEFAPGQGLKALVGGYGGAAEGEDPSIIMTPDEDDW